MLFNSAPFIFLFMPVLLALFFFALRRKSASFTINLMVLFSFVFYAVWNWRFVPLLLSSILFNFFLGRIINRTQGSKARRTAFAFAVASNLLCLGIFKYTGFAAAALNSAFAARLPVPNLILPLGISFFTFTQIAYLADVYRRVSNEHSLTKYALFVTYFPHLIAGPIIHHKEMIPQFERMRLTWRTSAVGTTMFVLGLAKKMLIADTLAPIADRVFDVANKGIPVTMLEAWTGILAYAFQLYFDFSGYCDMAIGLSLLFGVRLPVNFNSPYKSRSIIEFWQRWHMTLSRFLRDYLYIPLGGNRHGSVKRYRNLLVTMLLGGLWHGAGWGFIVWGGVHGVYLVINHFWHAALQRLPRLTRPVVPLVRWTAWPLTFLAVVLAWVPFRATSLAAAGRLGHALFLGRLGLPGEFARLLGPLAAAAERLGVSFGGGGLQAVDLPAALATLPVAAAIAFLLPNTQEILSRERPALDGAGVVGARIGWTADWRWAVLIAALAAIELGSLSQPSRFLYFQF